MTGSSEARIVVRAREQLAVLQELGCIVGYSEFGTRPPRFMVEIAKGNVKTLSAAEVELLKTGVDLGIEAMRKRGLA